MKYLTPCNQGLAGAPCEEDEVGGLFTEGDDPLEFQGLSHFPSRLSVSELPSRLREALG
jgi:hypothetical protein